MHNSNHVFIPHRLDVVGAHLFCISYHYSNILDPHPHTPTQTYPRTMFLKTESILPFVRGKVSTKYKVNC